MSQNKPYRPRLCTQQEKEPWERLVDLAKDKSPEWVLDAITNDNAKIEWNAEENSITTESTRIKTLEGLLEVAQVDQEIYDVERHIINSWEVTSWKRGFAETKTNFQVKAWLKNKWFDRVDPETVKEIIDSNVTLLSNVSQPRISNQEDPIVCVIADLHAGGFTEDMKLVPDFNIAELTKKFHRLSAYLNKVNRPVHLKLLGDLIESFTGKNHKDTWRQIEQHGMKVMFTVADLLIWLINETPQIISVDLISGNHDRISSSNDEDTEGQVAYAVAELIKRSGFDNVTFDPLIVSKEHDGVQYIMTHGHLPISKKNPAEIILDYGKQGVFNVVLKAHKHSEQVLKTTTKLRVHQCPSFVPANEYAEKLGAHSPTGFLIFEKNDLGSANVQTIAI